MLPWQQLVIDKNKPELIKITFCNRDLIEHLKTNHMISELESQKLAIPPMVDIERASLLYDLAKTRVNGFQLLIDALKKTNQTGASQTLTRSSRERDEYKKYKALDPKDEVLYPITSTVTVHEGTFGTRDVKVKLYSKYDLSSLAEAKNELNVLSKFDWHENIVRCFIGKYLTVKSLVHFAVGLDFQFNLVEFHKRRKDEWNFYEGRILRGLGNGVAFLHGSKVMHLNLKPRSVYIIERNEPANFTVKIGDFGFAVHNPVDPVMVCMKTLNDKGAASFLTPESLKFCDKLDSDADMENKFVHLTYATDIFCLGVLFFFVYSNGDNPFGRHLNKKKVQIEQGQKGMIINEHDLQGLNKDEKLIFKAMLSKKPEDRPTILKVHDLFHNSLKSTKIEPVSADINIEIS